jgi:hypothetical protein
VFSRRRLLLLVAAVAAGVAVAALPAGSASTPPDIFSVAQMPNLLGKPVTALFAVIPYDGDTLAAASVSVYAPPGYRFDLTAHPAAVVGQVVAISGFTSADLTVADPTAHANDACAPGLHAAVWTATVTIGGTATPITLYVDPTTGDETARGAYRITYCQTALLFFGLEGVVTAPSTPGSYLWRAFVTPPGTNGAPPDPNTAHELRVVVPTPHVLKAKATYVPRSHTLVITGRALAGGIPEPGAKVVVDRQGNSTKAFGTATTQADGTFTIKKAFKQTTSIQTLFFAADGEVPPGPCTTASLAPAGCLVQTTGASTTTFTARIPKAPKPKPTKR